MLVLQPSVKIYLYNCAIDMRKSYNSLSGTIIDQLGHNPLDGSVYVFHNKDKNKIKLLHWQPNGCWLHYRWLAKGRFIIPVIENNACIRSTDLYCLLESAANTAASSDKKLF